MRALRRRSRHLSICTCVAGERSRDSGLINPWELEADGDGIADGMIVLLEETPGMPVMA